MADHLDIYVRIAADAARYAAGLANAGTATRRFADGVRHEISHVKTAIGSMQGQLAMLGLGFSAAAATQEAGRLDKEMRLLQVSTGSSRKEMEGWRRDMLANQKNTGTLVSSQEELSGALQAAGLDIKQIRAVMEPASETMAVAKTNASQLGKALGVVSEQFKFDLTNTEQVRQLFDQMLVAGRLGNAELENLPDIFAKVGGRAREANLSFTQSLALIETLSKVEPQSDRLGTLVDSTLRVFSNAHYMKDASKATGVKFFNADGSRKEALVVLEEIKKKYDALGTDKDRFRFIAKAFGKADLDTQRGLKQLLDSGSLIKLHDYQQQIVNAHGAVKKDLPTAIDNAPDQINRLKASLREAVEDGFARPINDAITHAIGFAMDPKSRGGLELSGQNMLLGGAAAAAGMYGLTRIGGALLSKFGSTAGGVVAGKALEQAAGVTPVYVVNMPGGGIGGGDGSSVLGNVAGGVVGGAATRASIKAGMAMAAGLPLSEFVALGASAIATAGVGIAAAGAAGYGVGTMAYNSLEGTMAGDGLVDKVGGSIAKVLAYFGNENAQQAVAITEKLKNTDLGGTMKIVVETAPGTNANVDAKPASPRLRYQVGNTMQGHN